MSSTAVTYLRLDTLFLLGEAGLTVLSGFLLVCWIDGVPGDCRRLLLNLQGSPQEFEKGSRVIINERPEVVISDRKWEWPCIYLLTCDRTPILSKVWQQNKLHYSP